MGLESWLFNIMCELSGVVELLGVFFYNPRFGE